MANIKLLTGRLRDAWLDYPAALRSIRSFPPGPPIFVGGTHRSGTTWFARMLAEPGLWYVHEPFNPNKRIWPQEFTYAGPQTKRPDIDRYVKGLLRGRFRMTANNPNADHWMMPLRMFRPPVQRIMIKDPLACLLTGYLAQHFTFQMCVLFRHPAGFVSSVTRLGWPVAKFLRDFLTRRDLLNDHLGPYVRCMETYRDRDDVPAAAVLHGVLNTVQWNQIQANPDIDYYEFEKLCQDPLAAFREIFAEFALPYTAATRERHARLCLQGSSDPNEYHAHAVARNSGAMADSWKRQLNTDQIAQIRDIWRQFEIPLYQDDAEWDADHSELSPAETSPRIIP